MKHLQKQTQSIACDISLAKEKEDLCVAIDMGGTKLYAALMNFSGGVLREKEIVGHGLTGEGAYEAMRGVICEMADIAKAQDKPLRGVGVGIPSYIDKSGSVALHAPSLNWHNFPLLDRLKRDFEYEALIDNDLNLAADGEIRFGEGRNVSDFALIAVGTGLAAGIVLGGRVYSGAHGMAGEIGYSAFGKEFLRKEYPGFGPLELMAAGSGVARQAKDYLEEHKEIVCRDASAGGVFAACREGEPWAKEIVNNFADYLTMAIISICGVVDPASVILGGGVMKSADLFMERVRDNMRYSYFKDTPIKISELGKNAVVLGVATRLHQKLSDLENL